MKRIRNYSIFAIALVAAIAMAQDGFKLRRVPKVGEEIVMSLQADVDIMGTSAVFTAKVKDKVTKVDANGDYTVESTQSEGKIKIDAQEMDAGDGGSTTTKYASSGSILEMTGQDVSDEALRMANMNAYAVEDRMYKTGEVIKIENKPSKINGNVSSTATVTVGATETIAGHTTVMLTYTYKETTGEVPFESNGKVWLSLKDGAPVKVEGEFKNAPFPGAPAPINAKVKMLRL